MRTKALLVGAIIGVASLASSMAQVYSVNIVGYINVPIKHGWNLIANQLNNSGGNTVLNLMPAPPSAISVFTYNSAGQIYNQSNWDTDFLEWDDPTLPINPGQGAFILNAGAEWTLTLVGEVMTGTQTIPMVVGWQLVAPVVPQDLNLALPESAYTPSATGDSVFTYNATLQTYNQYNYDADFQEWDAQPIITVGQGMFILRTQAGAWTRTFNVN
jgi:hypothetical protein